MGFEFSPGRQRKTGMKWSLPSCSAVISGSHMAFLMWRSFYFDLDGTGGWQRDGPTTRKGTKSTEPELRPGQPDGARRTGVLGTQPRALFSHVNALPSLSHRTEGEFITIGPSHTETQRKVQDISATSTNTLPGSTADHITSANRPLLSLFISNVCSASDITGIMMYVTCVLLFSQIYLGMFPCDVYVRGHSFHKLIQW